MRLLVLGGTAWLSSLVVADAVARGHDVTALARGEAGVAPEGARFVRGDRTEADAYDDLGGDWDAVVDVSRQPGQVRSALAALSDRTAHWVFVSSCSVYADPTRVGFDEDARLHEPLDGDVMADMSQYSGAKVACERLVVDARGLERSHLARVSLIGGPGDRTGRGVYWPWRFAHPADADGRVLVPEAATPVQLVDARDLAAWLVDVAERRIPGAMNVGGETLTLGEHLAVAQQVAGGTAVPVPVDDGWLAAHGVQPWAGPRSLPLWLPPEQAGLNSGSTARAEAAGLRRRPLAETLADTLAWREAHPDLPLGSGLTDDEERALLAEFV